MLVNSNGSIFDRKKSNFALNAYNSKAFGRKKNIQWLETKSIFSMRTDLTIDISGNWDRATADARWVNFNGCKPFETIGIRSITKMQMLIVSWFASIYALPGFVQSAEQSNKRCVDAKKTHEKTEKNSGVNKSNRKLISIKWHFI